MDHDDGEKEDGCLFPPEFWTRAFAIQFHGTEGRSNPTLVDPFDGNLHEIATTGIIAAMRGKRCVACTGSNWFLVLDEASRECFLTTLFVTSPAAEESSPETATAVVRLPPMPTDPPQLESFLFNCALSAPAPTAPGCVVVLGITGETYLLYCRPGDETWSRIAVITADYEWLDGAVAFHAGKIYAATTASRTAVLDASSPAPAAPRVESTDVAVREPFLCNYPRRQHLVATTSPDGLYFVRAHLFGFPEEVIGVDVFRWDASSRGAWREVDSLGDAALFVGGNCVAVSPGTEAGSDPNCVHILRSRHDAVKVHSVCLRDRTIRCDIVRLDHDYDYSDDDTDDGEDTSPPPETQAYWSLPSSCRHTPMFDSMKLESQHGSSDDDDDEQENIIEQASECAPQWSSLPTDLLASHVVPKLSFIDFLHLKSVCKEWRGIPATVRDTKAWPLLMTPSYAQLGSTKRGSFDVFDPVSKNKYTLSVQVPGATVVQDGDSSALTLHCSRNGWVLVSRGRRSFFLVNPFKRGATVIILPPVHDVFMFKGISFCATPGCADFSVMLIEGDDENTISTRTWREGQESWQQHADFDCEVPFLVATHNPLFLDGEFYCLARDGKLAVFTKTTMAWRLLDGLEPIVTDDFATGREAMYMHLVEWKGEAVVVIRYADMEEPIQMFRLDRSRMAWSKVEELEDGAVFWDRKQAVARRSSSLARGFGCNKVYEPAFTESQNGVRECVFYSCETKEYSNCRCDLFGLKEPLNALWFQPNLDDFQ